MLRGWRGFQKVNRAEASVVAACLDAATASVSEDVLSTELDLLHCIGINISRSMQLQRVTHVILSQVANSSAGSCRGPPSAC